MLTFDILFYPSFLPKVITTDNSQWIEQSGYVFYIVFILGILIESYGIYRILQYLTFKVSNNDGLTFKQNSIVSKASGSFKYFLNLYLICLQELDLTKVQIISWY